MHSQYNNIGHPVMRLIEELSELQKALCKAERFGWENFHPLRPERSNKMHVKEEMQDVLDTMAVVVSEYGLE